jgi:hypothetical protein
MTIAPTVCPPPFQNGRGSPKKTWRGNGTLSYIISTSRKWKQTGLVSTPEILLTLIRMHSRLIYNLYSGEHYTLTIHWRILSTDRWNCKTLFTLDYRHSQRKEVGSWIHYGLSCLLFLFIWQCVFCSCLFVYLTRKCTMFTAMLTTLMNDTESLLCCIHVWWKIIKVMFVVFSWSTLCHVPYGIFKTVIDNTISPFRNSHGSGHPNDSKYDTVLFVPTVCPDHKNILNWEDT